MHDETENIPVDAKLLADAVIELNISRRSVGMYPADHPIVKRSITRAFEYLQKLFELQNEITLGITNDSLVIGDFSLDKKNPVFREFAVCLHSRGVAGITFSGGLTKDEIVSFHELLVSKDTATGAAFAELAGKRNIRHISLHPLDISALGFVEGETRSDRSGDEVIEDVVYALVHGSLASGTEDIIRSIPPEAMASFINKSMDADADETAYERVIATYITSKEDKRLGRESFVKYMKFVEKLSPEIRKRFISAGFDNSSVRPSEIEELVTELDQSGMEQTMKVFSENESIIPPSLKGVLDKLSGLTKKGVDVPELFNKDTSSARDIEIAEYFAGLLEKGSFDKYFSKEYRRELDEMLRASAGSGQEQGQLRAEFTVEAVDRLTLDVMLELLGADEAGKEDCSALVIKITDYIGVFIGTGRISEIADACNALMSKEMRLKIGPEAAEIAARFFRSDEFLTKLIEALRVWGRKDLDGSLRLAKNLHDALINPLLDVLAEETDAGMRKFLLSMLVIIGENVCPHAVKRLADNRASVIAAMLYLIRECGCSGNVAEVRKLARHESMEVWSEAVKTLLHFRAADGISYVRAHLQGKDEEAQLEAAKLAGEYRLREAAPLIAALIEKPDLLGAVHDHKLELVGMLGKIGDPGAMPVLIRICRSKALLFRERLDELKLEVYRSLRGYPYEAAAPLIELGLSSKNKPIMAICERLRKNRQSPAGRG